MAGLQKSNKAASGISFTLNMHKGNNISVQDFPLPPGVAITSSDTSVCVVSLKNGTISLTAVAKGVSVLTANILGVAVPGKVTVKVW